MNKIYSSINKNWLLFAAIVLVLLLFYLFFVKPVQQEVKNKEYAVNRLSTDVFSLKNEQSEIENMDEELPTEIYQIRKKIPEQSAINELLLQLEEIEYVSKVRIETVTFNNYDVPASEVTMYQIKETNISASEEDKQKVGLTEETSEPITAIDYTELPSELKLLTYELTISASSKERIERFVKEMEQLERSMKIEHIVYKLPGEGQQEIEDVLALQAKVRVTAFYYEGAY